MSNEEIPSAETSAKIFNAVGSVLVPVVIGLCGVWFSYNNRVADARKQCADQAVKLVELVKITETTVAGNPTSCALQISSVKAHRQILEAACSHSDTPAIPSVLALPSELTCELRRETPPSPVVPVEDGEKSAMETQPHIVQEAAEGKLNRRRITLYVQISDETQRTALRGLLKNLRDESALPSSPISISTPGIELVAPQPTTTLRCLKIIDCNNAEPLLDLLNAELPNQDITLLDLSGRFNSASHVKAGTYELWLRSGPINVK